MNPERIITKKENKQEIKPDFSNPNNFYAVLGVPKAADLDQIKNAYRKLARQYHPDLNPDGSVAAERMKYINAAYETLSDADLRLKYDNLSLGSNSIGEGLSWEDLISNIFETTFQNFSTQTTSNPRNQRVQATNWDEYFKNLQKQREAENNSQIKEKLEQEKGKILKMVGSLINSTITSNYQPRADFIRYIYNPKLANVLDSDVVPEQKLSHVLEVIQQKQNELELRVAECESIDDLNQISRDLNSELDQFDREISSSLSFPNPSDFIDESLQSHQYGYLNWMELVEKVTRDNDIDGAKQLYLKHLIFSYLNKILKNSFPHEPIKRSDFADLLMVNFNNLLTSNGSKVSKEVNNIYQVLTKLIQDRDKNSPFALTHEQEQLMSKVKINKKIIGWGVEIKSN